ncbi:MAG: hypothetical protein AAGC67_12855 [Myxococcota bacterium]
MHEFDRGVTKYDIMPIPPVEAQCEKFDAGPVTIWVEYRLLDDAIAAAHQANEGFDGTVEQIDDRGVSLHVFGESSPGGERVEFLRFDCFDEDPHYHYVSYAENTNEMVHLETAAMGDPLEWAMDRIRTRLPQMLARAGATELAARVDPTALERALPKVAEAAYRARFGHDDAAIHAGAMATAEPVAKAGGALS